jgi:hypothetical protein
MRKRKMGLRLRELITEDKYIKLYTNIYPKVDKSLDNVIAEMVQQRVIALKEEKGSKEREKATTNRHENNVNMVAFAAAQHAVELHPPYPTFRSRLPLCAARQRPP